MSSGAHTITDTLGTEVIRQVENKQKKTSYTAPKIVEYGRMEQLTRGPWGGAFDALFGRNGGFDPSGGRSN